MEPQSSSMKTASRKYPPGYPIARLIEEAPDVALVRVNSVLENADGLIPKAAEKLFVSARTLRRWIKRLRDGKHAVGPVRVQGSGPTRNFGSLPRKRKRKQPKEAAS